MPGPKQPERGTKTPYRARYRVNVGPCEGIDNAHDISTPVDEALIEAINVRVHDGIVVNRFGQANVTGGDPMTGCVTGLSPVQQIGAKLFLAPPRAGGSLGEFDAYNGRGTEAGSYSRVTDDLQNVVFPLLVDALSTTTARFCFAFWKDAPHMVASQPGGTDYAWYRIIPPEDDGEVNDVQIEEVFKFPAGITPTSVVTLLSGAEDDSRRADPIFFGTLGGGVYGYTNRLAPLLGEGSLTGRVIVARLHNTLYAFGTNECLRQRGWADGEEMLNGTIAAWDAVALPAGVMPAGVDDFRPTCWAEHGDYLYVGGWDETPYALGNDAAVILRLEEPTATLVPALTIGYVPSVKTDTGKLTEMVAHKDVLYFAFTWDLPGSQFCDLGSFDGTVWREGLYDFGSETEPYIGRMVSTGGVIYATRGSPDEAWLSIIYAEDGTAAAVGDLINVRTLFTPSELPACDMIPW